MLYGGQRQITEEGDLLPPNAISHHLRSTLSRCSMYAMLNHPAIVRLHGVSLLGERPFVLLELSELGTLEENIVYGFSVHVLTMKNYLLSIMIEVAAALHHMQNRPQ